MKLLQGIAVLVVALGAVAPLGAQVMTPVELSDPKAQRLQQIHLRTLMAIGTEIEAHTFPYPFYFSRVLDVDLPKMQLADQRSIRFDVYKGQTVLEITGNYYAAYSADRMDSYARLKETFQQVVMPLLQVEVPRFPDDSEFSAFAIEVSHHVRQKVMGVSSEIPENVTVIIPVPVAQKLVDAKSDDQKQAAILEAKVFLNGQPFSLWLQEGAPSEEWKERTAPEPARKPSVETASSASNAAGSNNPTPTVAASLMKTAPTPMRIFTQEELSNLQRQNDDAIARMTKDLDKEAHFLPYAAPSFIGFRQGAYLQLSISTRLDAAAGTSRYKLAALAFDDHVSHLVRPLLNYFPQDPDFDGVDFSSMVHVADGSSPLAVEFFFPFRMMRCFANYDCTGQQLLDSGTVVINGERSALDLQIAEGKN
ncbi:MAG: hypothetical protein ABSD98_13400 [Candidatus Korobacteraceae bacterium]|jgi:hypothetical protein